MTRYVIRRLLMVIPVLWGITLVTFFLVDAMPGDYIDCLVPPDLQETVPEEYLTELRRLYGLDKPVAERYVIWLRELVFHGNMGYSFMTGEPVLKDMLARLPATLQLTAGAMVFSLVAGVGLGILAAVRQYSLFDQVLTVFTFLWISIPGFVFALGALYLFHLKIPLFPGGHQHPLGTGETYGPLTYLYYMILPMTTLGIGGVAGRMRYARASLLDTLHQDYITVARAKGLAERAVYLTHALRNALLPLITIMGLSLPRLIGGSVIIENIFSWPGLGKFSMTSITTRNFPAIMAVNFVSSLMVLISTLIADILYAWADPRIRYD